VVSEEQLTRASALTVGAGVCAWTIGSACADLCYVSLGAGWAMAVNAASFGLAPERRAGPQRPLEQALAQQVRRTTSRRRHKRLPVRGAGRCSAGRF